MIGKKLYRKGCFFNHPVNLMIYVVRACMLENLDVTYCCLKRLNSLHRCNAIN